MTRAAVYCRISQDKEGRRLGVERQEEDCRALATRNGWDVVDVFTDNDITAAKVKGGKVKVRPEYDRMVAAIKAGKVDAIVAYSQSRLTRTGTIEGFIDLCEAAGIESVAIVTGAAINPGGNLVTARVQAAVDAEYVRKLSEDGKRAKRQILEAGQWLGGRRPYGYQIHKPSPKVPSVLVVDEAEAARVRGWARDVLGGRSLNALADACIAEGVPTSTGRGTWAPQTIRRILLNRVYLAEPPAQWEAILDVETFTAVGAILGDKKRRPKKIGARYPLVGVLRCYCGERMVSRPTNKHGASIRRYGCRAHGTVSAEQAEEDVFNTVARLADLPRVGQIIRDAEGHEDEEAQALRVANAEDSAAIADLLGAVGNGVTMAQVRPQVAALNARIAEREAQLVERAGRSALDRFAGRVVSQWDTLDVEDQRAILLSLVRNVVVGPKVNGYGWHSERLQPVWRFSALAAIKWPEPTAADEAEQQRLSDEYREEEDLAQLRADNAEADAETRAAG